MRVGRTYSGRLTIARDLVLFFWQRRLWWLIPLVSLLLIVGLLFVFAQSSAIAPFIYTLF